MTRRRLRLVLSALGIALLAATTAVGEEIRATPPGTAEKKAAAAEPVRPRLAAWRDGARPPREVPPAAIVRAAKRDDVRGTARQKAAARAVRPEPVEIIWHAPGS